jgi:diguanylate cyclase
MNTSLRRREIPEAVKRKVFVMGVVYAGCLVLLLGAVELAIYVTLSSMIDDEMDTTQWMVMKSMSERLSSLLARQQSDFLIVGTSEAIARCVEFRTVEDCQPAISLMTTAMKVDGNIDHMRAIDTSGMEIARVNRNSANRLEVVAAQDLQSKKHRGYVKEALKTGEQQIYISRIDLNIEDGQIELPHKPVIRFGKAVRSDRGRLLGCFVVNYRAENLMGRLSATVLHTRDRWYLVNENGHYLHTDKIAKNFSFMWPERRHIGFFNDYPSVWKQFWKDPSRPVTTPAGKFYLSTISVTEATIEASVPRKWILVMHVPPSVVFASYRLLLMGLLAGAIVLLPILAILGWKIGSYRMTHRWYVQELAISATTDSLTGLLNHRGTVDAIDKALAIANRRESSLALVFVDVNDLKLTNDAFGHRKGDRLIVGTANALAGSLRQTDIVGRLGGDEFVVALIDCDERQVEAVMARAEIRLAQQGVTETGSPWTMSWGYAFRGENDTFDRMVARADQQMYAHKRALKMAQPRRSRNGGHSHPPEIKS